MQRIYFRRGENRPVGLSNWFIAAVPNQIIVSSILDIVLAYWKDYDYLVDYYIFHLFLGLALHEFPAIEAKMSRENSFHSIMLGDALARTFCQEQWQNLIDHVSSLNPLPSPRPFQKGKGCNRSSSSLLTAAL